MLRKLGEPTKQTYLKLLIVGVVLLLAGLAACAWPALRASRINPVNVLRAS